MPRLPVRYIRSFEKWIEPSGDYDPSSGLYEEVEGGGWVPTKGIILPLTRDELRRSENGMYTVHDRKILLEQPEEPLKHGQKIRYKGNVYVIDGEQDYSDYAGVWIYFAQREGDVDA